MYWNASILKHMRGTDGRDRYGQPLFETVRTHVPCRMIQNQRLSVLATGVEGTIDADLWVPAHVEMRQNDQVIIDDDRQSTWLVQTINEVRDVRGKLRTMRCGLTKKQETRLGQAD